MSVPTVKLPSGHPMPMLGMGTWHHGPKEEIKEAVKFSIRNGYHHIDGAHIYLNEVEIGEVYAELIGKGEVKREELFLTSKLWNTHHHPDHVEEALRNSLRKLNLDYLDLYYIHWPSAFKYGDVNLPIDDDDGRVIQTDDDFVDTWKALESMVEKGLIRNIGLCNFNCLQIKRILSACKIKPAVLQLESNPRCHNDIMRQFCEKHGIVMMGYSPFGSPDLPWGEKLPHILADKSLAEIGKKHGKSPAQVVLRWQMQRGVAVIPKSIIESELLDNLKIFDFVLDNDDLGRIKKLDQNLRKIIPVTKLRDGTFVPRDENSKFNSFDHVETLECLKD